MTSQFTLFNLFEFFHFLLFDNFFPFQFLKHLLTIFSVNIKYFFLPEFHSSTDGGYIIWNRCYAQVSYKERIIKFQQGRLTSIGIGPHWSHLSK